MVRRYTQLGWISFLAVGVMACAIPVTLLISKRMMLAFFSIKVPQDQRLNALDEALQAMDVVKVSENAQNCPRLAKRASGGDILTTPLRPIPCPAYLR